MEIWLQFGLLIIGFAMLAKGADFFVDGAAGIAQKFGIPQLVIGLTIVAMGTSAPEASVSITAAMKGSADITIGNIVGSNIMNVFVILGLTSVIVPIAVQRSTVRVELPFMIAVSGLLLYFGMDGAISFYDGVILCVLLAVYLFYLYRMAMKDKAIEETQEESHSMLYCIISTIGGLVVVMYGSDVAVSAATAIAAYAGLSERFIGLTVVALGTSLPELFTSVTAARKGNADIAIGNIVGSNVFNVLFVVGLSSLIIDVPFAKAFQFDMWVAIGAAVLLWLCVLPKNQLARWGGVLMLAGYGAYFWHLL